MTIPEAVGLVIQAGAMAKGGEIFILDMGEPVKIADLAKNIDLRKNYRVAGPGSDFMDIFKREFELRVDWEILSEFALTSQLGRTLEKTGASAVFFNQDVIEDVFNKMEEWLNNNSMERILENEMLLSISYMAFFSV